MILRVLDYFNDFHCLADRCRNSCCIGWEIDIDDDTYDYYRSISGELGRRLKENMYRTQEGDYSFRLAAHGRCPFLNQRNLCDICAALGEEAFSEVCTEYPRFSVYYKNVLQKTLAVSCEEAGRLLFTHPGPVRILDLVVPSQGGLSEEESSACEDAEYEPDLEEDPRVIAILEEAQSRLIGLLQDGEKTLEIRITDLFRYGESIQEKLNILDADSAQMMADTNPPSAEEDFLRIDRPAAFERFQIFDEMEVLDLEWKTEKEKLLSLLNSPDYEKSLSDYLSSPDYREKDYESLLVYFVFRYCMTAVLNMNLKSKLRLALEFTLMLRDMAAVRFLDNKRHFSIEDLIDIARIFSREVEHSEENVAYAEEEFLWT